MNKRARNRLIGVTAIVLLVIVAIFASIGNQGGTAYYKTVDEIAGDASLASERVKVGGAVVSGSWDRRSNPMRFTIKGEDDTNDEGPTVKVVYNGAVPATFGDGVTAIVTGEISADGTIEADEMITKCPSKYESATGALPVGDLVGSGESMVGTTVKAVGYVKAGTIVPPGGEQRFAVTNDANGGVEVGVVFEGALPSGMTDGSKVIITGAIEEDGLFVATEVALDAAEQ